MGANNITLAFLIGLLSTTQLHLAKAFERQGIVIFEQLQARRRGQLSASEGGLRKPLIYVLGVMLNNTVFIYAILAQRLAPPAVYTSMFGFGLIVLMLYAERVLGEDITRDHLMGTFFILVGTVVLGIDNIQRAALDRFVMALRPALLSVVVFIALGAVLMVSATRSGRVHMIGAAFGLFCGGYGSLDPFLKGMAQNMQGQPRFIPDSWQAWAIFLPSFLIGFMAFVLTQVAFARRAPASTFVPFYNASYILLPVCMQSVLLPDYRLYRTTLAGMFFIVLGVVLMRNLFLKEQEVPHAT